MGSLTTLTLLLLVGAACAETPHPAYQSWAVGEDVVKATEKLIANTCIFPHDHGFYRRLAYFYTRDGREDSEGGIYKVSLNTLLLISHILEYQIHGGGGGHRKQLPPPHEAAPNLILSYKLKKIVLILCKG